MSSYTDLLEDKGCHNWIKCALALKIAQGGLVEFVETVFAKVQNDVWQQAIQIYNLPPGTTCNECFTSNLLPCRVDSLPKCSKTKCCKLHKDSSQKQRLCPNFRLCDALRERIEQLHRYKNPSWANTDATKWCKISEWFQITKCFLPQQGYEKVACVRDTDFNGLINCIIACTAFQKYFSEDMSKQDNLCIKIRQMSRNLRHSPTMAMADSDMTDLLQALITLISDTKYLNNQTYAKDALNKLLQLQNDTLAITSEDIALVIKDSNNDGFKEKVKGLEDLSTKLKADMEIHSLNLVHEIEHKIVNVGETMLQKITETASEQLKLIDCAIQKQTVGIEATTLATDEQKRIQNWLINKYKTMYNAMPLSMLDSSFDAPLENVYVQPNMFLMKRGNRNTPLGEREIVHSYKEFLFPSDNRCENIFLQGEPGTGKTTFCRRLALDWCKAHDTTPAHYDGENNECNDLFTDFETLREYMFLFILTLRDMSDIECNTEEMIKCALGIGDLEDLYKHSWLVVYDGGDEWTHPQTKGSKCKCSKSRALPYKNIMANVTYVTTCRPWKLSQIQLSDTNDKRFEITGINDIYTLAEHVLRYLKQHDDGHLQGIEQLTSDFHNLVQTKKLSGLMVKPAIAMQLIHQWYVGRLVPSSHCSVYINMIDMKIARALERLGTTSIQVEDTDAVTLSVPVCVKQSECDAFLQNMGFIFNVSELAFNTLFHADKESSIVFRKEQLNSLKPETIRYCLATGILEERRPFCINVNKHMSYAFLHKTVQEFFAATYIAMNANANNSLQLMDTRFSENSTFLDISQLFLFICGLDATAANYLSTNIMDTVTENCSTELANVVANSVFGDLMFGWITFPNYDQIILAQTIITNGLIECLESKQTDVCLSLYHVTDNMNAYRMLTDSEVEIRNRLLNMNTSNVRSIESIGVRENPLPSEWVHTAISNSGETLLYLSLVCRPDNIDLASCSNLIYLHAGGDTTIVNAITNNLQVCILSRVPVSTERVLLDSIYDAGDRLKYIYVSQCKNINLWLRTISRLRSLQRLELRNTELDDVDVSLHRTVSSIIFMGVRLSANSLRSLVEWSTTLDHKFEWRLGACKIEPESQYQEICQWVRNSDNIIVTEDTMNETGKHIFRWIAN